MSVALHDLCLISLKNLSSRVSRTLFLSIGVVIGTAILLFVIGLIGGVNDIVQVNIDRSVEKVKADQQAILDQQRELQRRLQGLLTGSAVHRIEVLPTDAGQGEIKESDVKDIERKYGDRIATISKVAFLFPMFMELRLVDFEVELAGNKIDFSKFNQYGQRVPIPVYGVESKELEGQILGPDQQPTPDAARYAFAEKGPIPIVVPSTYFDLVRNMANEDMREKFKQDLAQRMFEEMQDPKKRERYAQRFGENFLTRFVGEEAIDSALEQILDKMKPENVKKHFQVVLYTGFSSEDEPMATEIVGMSRAIPTTGMTLPTEYIARWQKDHFVKNTSAAMRMLRGKPETSYAKVVIHGKDLDSTIEIVDGLRDRYLVAAEIEQARRLRDESRRIDDERVQLEAKERALLAESDRIREIVGTVEDGAWMVGLLIFLLAGVGIVNGQTLSVMEQAKRIGILRAVGARRRDILFIFLSEAILIGLVGSVLGIGLAEAAMRLADVRLPQTLPEMAFRPDTFFQVSWQLRGLVVGVGVLVSLAAGLFPAMKGSWIRPVEVLKD